MANLNLTEITFSKLKSQIETFLSQEYAKSNILFSVGSPYGQILFAIENFFQLSMLYLKNTIVAFDLSDSNSNNPRTIRNAAVLAGHNPTRAVSASGTLRISIKTSVDISTAIPGSKITLFDKQTIKNKTNGLKYSILLGSDKTAYKIDNNTQIYLNIIQGYWKTTPFTGTGAVNQTYQVTMRSNNQDVENFNVQVLVDGVYWAVKTWLYDLLPSENAVVIKTGYNGGIDVVFGNGYFGNIPLAGANIQISYLVTDGAIGSIFRRTPNDWTFIDLAIDGFGNTIDMSNLFDVRIYTDINFGADAENIQFTKNLLPISSNNFVLALPEQYAYAIKRLGVFSYVNAYEQYGSIYIVVTPNIVLFKNQNSDYFSIPLSVFTLDSYEISKIDSYLKAGGNILLTKKYQILSPTISLYAMNVFIVVYSDAQIESVKSQIYSVISNYFLNINKTSRIPKVEIITALAQISDINSVDINFISNKNEQYHIQNIAIINNRKSTAVGTFNLSNQQASIGYNATQVNGIDPTLGDILFDANEIPVIRGGFNDRNGNYYSDDINSNGLKSVNIFVMGTIDVSQKPKK